MVDDTSSLMGKSLACMNRFIADKLRDAGLEGIVPSHGDILVYLLQEDEVSMGQIAEHIAREPSTTTTLVRKLEEYGYVSTRKDPDDGRVVLARLTERGRALEPAFTDISRELGTISQKNISKRDWQTARDVLRQIQRNFEEEES